MYRSSTHFRLPPLLNAASVLSEIGSLTGTLLYFSAAIFFNETKELVLRITNSQAMNGINPSYFILFGWLYLVSLSGILKIRQLKRSGYWIYLICQLTILFTPMIKLGTSAFSATNTIFTVLFLFIYSLFYHRYRKKAH